MRGWRGAEVRPVPTVAENHGLLDSDGGVETDGNEQVQGIFW